MKLELRFLAPYLPYGLRLTECDQPMNARICELICASYSHTRKPILRPMAGLNTDDDAWSHNKENIDHAIEFDTVIEDLSYSTVQLMIANHYDVFGLIEQDLAIDINTLTKS